MTYFGHEVAHLYLLKPHAWYIRTKVKMKGIIITSHTLKCKTVFFLYLICISDLKTVDADKVYVLGGLVDESIQKVLRSCSELLLY